MGWDGQYLDRKLGYNELKAFIGNKWNDSNVDKTIEYKCEKIALRSNVAFIVVSKTNVSSGTQEKFIAITLYSQTKNENGYGYEIITKELTEHSGSFDYTCPVSYIKELGGVDGTDNMYAQEWRKRVIAYAESKKKIENCKKNRIPVKLTWGEKEIEVVYSHYFKKWIVSGENTYIPAKFIKPGRVTI